MDSAKHISPLLSLFCPFGILDYVELKRTHNDGKEKLVSIQYNCDKLEVVQFAILLYVSYNPSTNNNL